ncbi:hypothetical protein [Vagococcus carniphilus]|uniref:Uncharacterized protein n=1 Tax=Vagococcus carniphilus TaxID=218144 RepID=A0A430B640_9ENTE|nr:hypothetical protein [Vagococcus carniphilus]QNN72674.1 hypothetical protein H9L18_12545 [Vagococcus carniphilus]RSU15780.1 hypothetical protein CBF28_04920 [Vagococcus carniphilus]
MNKEDKNQTRSLKNDRSNKDLLRTEINNATDPNVRLELTKMLLEIENEEKKRKVRRWAFVGALILGIILLLLYLGTQETKEKQPNSSIEAKTSMSTEESTVSTTTDSSISETNLTEEQLKKWVMSILDLLPPPSTRYVLDVYTENDLVYIRVGVDQSDNLSIFRVNHRGELEASVAITGVLGKENWTLMSDKYLDTTIASEFLKERDKKITSNNSNINKAREILIGKKYTIVPELYDGQDATQAMDDNKAPQNLIHDGAQDIEFLNDTEVHIGLLGNYRPDFDDTYSLTKDTLIIRDNHIPYTINDQGISFSSWTSDMDGHTITWQIRER